VSGLFGAQVNEELFARTIAAGGGHAAAQGIVEGFMRAIEGEAAASSRPVLRAAHGSRPRPSRRRSRARSTRWRRKWRRTSSRSISGTSKELTKLPEEILQTLGVSRLDPARRGAARDGVLHDADGVAREQEIPPDAADGRRSGPAGAPRQVDEGQSGRGARAAGLQQRPDRRAVQRQAKFFSPGDVRTFETREHWTREQAIQHLKDQGYDEQGAVDALRLEGLRRFEQLETQEANAIISAYASRDIDAGRSLALLGTAVSIATERALFRSSRACGAPST
jgi:hypothetical protein